VGLTDGRTFGHYTYMDIFVINLKYGVHYKSYVVMILILIRTATQGLLAQLPTTLDDIQVTYYDFLSVFFSETKIMAYYTRL
jgi:hypothetical protein